MKKHLFFFFFVILVVVCYAQAFDDMPFSNPSNMTYFQQEMLSSMRFQAENNVNIPFFASVTQKSLILGYQSNYLKSLYSDYPDFFDEITASNGLEDSKGAIDMNILLGAQIRISNEFHIPIFFSMGSSGYSRNIEEYVYKYDGVEYKAPAVLIGGSADFFFGSGVFINTDILKGSIYIGWNIWANSDDTRITLPNPDHRNIENEYFTDSMGSMIMDNSGFKFALVPLLNTSEWRYIGIVLNNILGYLGMGETVIYADDKEDSKMRAVANSINTALDFTFNRIDFGVLGLTAQTIYARGNFDAAAKTDTFGLKLNGLFSSFPFGFTFEGGYKHFYSVAKYFEDDYLDTGYFSGSIYFPLKRITLGIIYKYDRINNSMITLALSTNFLSGFLGLNIFDSNSYDKKIYKNDNLNGALGARFRWGGWKIGNNSN